MPYSRVIPRKQRYGDTHFRMKYQLFYIANKKKLAEGAAQFATSTRGTQPFNIRAIPAQTERPFVIPNFKLGVLAIDRGSSEFVDNTKLQEAVQDAIQVTKQASQLKNNNETNAEAMFCVSLDDLLRLSHKQQLDLLN